MLCGTDDILQNISDIPTFNMNVRNLNNGMVLVGINIPYSNEKILDYMSTHWGPATSHTSQEPWPWYCEMPKESVQRPSYDTSIIM
jgi:hypothetical protein